MGFWLLGGEGGNVMGNWGSRAKVEVAAFDGMVG